MHPWVYQLLEVGAMGSEIFVLSANDKAPLTPDQMFGAQTLLDEALLQESNESWLECVAPWAGTHRWVSGSRSETRAFIATINKSKRFVK